MVYRDAGKWFLDFSYKEASLICEGNRNNWTSYLSEISEKRMLKQTLFGDVEGVCFTTHDGTEWPCFFEDYFPQSETEFTYLENFLGQSAFQELYSFLEKLNRLPKDVPGGGGTPSAPPVLVLDFQKELVLQKIKEETEEQKQRRKEEQGNNERALWYIAQESASLKEPPEEKEPQPYIPRGISM